MVPFPLLTPQTLLWTRLPPVARLNARGPQGRLVPQGSTLDGSGAFRSAKQALCTVWPRTVMRGGLRKVTSGHNSVPKPARRTEPSPRFPRLAANALLSGSKEGLGESRGGKGTIRCPFPLLPLAVGTAFPAGEHRHSPPPVGGNLPSPWVRHSRPPKAATPPRPRGRKAASTGCAAVSAEGLPSANGKKERADARWGGQFAKCSHLNH